MAQDNARRHAVLYLHTPQTHHAVSVLTGWPSVYYIQGNLLPQCILQWPLGKGRISGGSMGASCSLSYWLGYVGGLESSAYASSGG